ncbi:hypothetical protein LMIY3S_03692 [Labrys miyagiensis]
MTTYATAIRDAIYERVKALPGYSFRKEPVPTLDEDDLPCMTVFIVNEILQPDGDANVAEPSFEATSTIAISIMRGFKDPITLDGQADRDIDMVENRLLTDPTFVGRGPSVAAPFESIRGITRRRLYPSNGDTFLLELRLEMQFFNRIYFEPVVTTELSTVHVEATPVGSNQPQPVVGEWTLPS